jgi:hypothetical protein
MLMLACVHDPCINCAATSYAEQIHIKGQSNQVLNNLFRATYVKFVENKPC